MDASENKEKRPNKSEERELNRPASFYGWFECLEAELTRLRIKDLDEGECWEGLALVLAMAGPENAIWREASV
ncbi:hypothetical protein MLD52_20295 [Puniceicoccaceae bacterium K14]|nr:hypothetical protein [Puniceicoccaceae bacterium K14]